MPWEVPNEIPSPSVAEPPQQPNNPNNQNIQQKPQKQGSPTALDAFLIFASFIGSAVFFVSAPVWIYIFSMMLGFDWSKSTIEVPVFVSSLFFLLFSSFTGPLIVGGTTTFLVLRKYVNKSSKPNRISLIVTFVILIILVLFLSLLLIA